MLPWWWWRDVDDKSISDEANSRREVLRVHHAAFPLLLKNLGCLCLLVPSAGCYLLRSISFLLTTISMDHSFQALLHSWQQFNAFMQLKEA
ncbi:hypothetical protein MUK42_09031 [Musa troglodytarum]|uniref:Uncharacterized protein n=1 Tax=Musa troglodytarum TaxID=320322 RepID=A0A9E7EYI9_9LILI|nr:hypothetical protein MUK42_09031 [Musa troglodytarum]